MPPQARPGPQPDRLPGGRVMNSGRPAGGGGSGGRALGLHRGAAILPDPGILPRARATSARDPRHRGATPLAGAMPPPAESPRARQAGCQPLPRHSREPSRPLGRFLRIWPAWPGCATGGGRPPRDVGNAAVVRGPAPSGITTGGEAGWAPFCRMLISAPAARVPAIAL